MVLIQDIVCQCQENDDDHDSGTESDDEGADAEELEKFRLGLYGKALGCGSSNDYNFSIKIWNSQIGVKIRTD
ncbi:hypothetical protein CDAR_4472 [Caerostris darwini]|uniref:Uncharacterized protein n=1 Tax=Caerostris darwini TaxID=1538125 RepID=A0AAV4SSZ5_9ARAC|nr:hypothetical protein CDAR_4472 [Caerostris darwini]